MTRNNKYLPFLRRVFAVATVLLGLAACPGYEPDIIVGPSASRPTEFNTSGYAASITLGESWGFEFNTFVEGDLTNARLLYSVDDPKVVRVIPGYYSPIGDRFSTTTGQPGVLYDEILEVKGIAIGKTTVTVWPPTAPSKKWRLSAEVTNDFQKGLRLVIKPEGW